MTVTAKRRRAAVAFSRATQRAHMRELERRVHAARRALRSAQYDESAWPFHEAGTSLDEVQYERRIAGARLRDAERKLKEAQR